MPNELSEDRLSAALRGIPEATASTRFDALRVVTHIHLHRYPIEPVSGGTPLSGVRSVLEGLGLAEPPEPVKVWTGLRAVPCPDCPAGVGEWCVSRNDKRFTNGHVNRHRLLDEMPAG